MDRRLATSVADWRRNLQALKSFHGQYDADLISANTARLLEEANEIIKECEDVILEYEQSAALGSW